jgi:hypothetical protein
VTWSPTDVPFDQRFERYLDYSFFEHKVCEPGSVSSWVQCLKLYLKIVVCLCVCDVRWSSIARHLGR